VISVPSEEGCSVLGRGRKKKGLNLTKERKINIYYGKLTNRPNPCCPAGQINELGLSTVVLLSREGPVVEQ
jgi:hypothetical protein